MLERVKLSKRLDKVIVAIPDTKENDCLEKLCKKCGVLVFRGSEDDVLSRYYGAAKKYHVDVVVRLTSDCPLIDYGMVDMLINKFLKNKVDYLSNIGENERTYPDGEDCEIFSFEALLKAHSEAKTQHDRQHVTTYICTHENEFKLMNIKYPSNKNLSHLRWTVDFKSDFDMVSTIFLEFYPRIDFSITEILDLLECKPEITKINSDVVGNDNIAIARHIQKTS